MSRQRPTGRHGDKIPRGALLGAAGLVVVAIVSAYMARSTDVGTLHMPEAVALESRDLRFEDREDGGITVFEITAAGEQLPLTVLEPGSNGFVRGVLRGLARERRRRGLGAETPFRLATREDGRFTLEDPAIGRTIDLKAFGPTNTEAFARLLRLGSAAGADDVDDPQSSRTLSRS